MDISAAYAYEHTNARVFHNDMARFSNILSKHALVMVDAATLVDHSNDKTFYVQLGERLARVQTAWASRFCRGDAGSDSEEEERYHWIVYKVIVDFTNRLMQMLVDDVHIKASELTALISGLHAAALERDAEWYLQRTRELFAQYVNALMHMFRTNNQHDYESAALQCLTVAFTLGSWLDMTM